MPSDDDARIKRADGRELRFGEKVMYSHEWREAEPRGGGMDSDD